RSMNVTGLDIGQRPALGFIINPALDLDTLPNDALLRNHLSHDVRYRTLPKAEYGATLLQPGVSKNFIDQFIELLNIPINARHLFFQSLGRTRGLNHLNTKTNPCHWRSQFVGHRVNHLALNLHQTLDMLGHTIK